LMYNPMILPQPYSFEHDRPYSFVTASFYNKFGHDYFYRDKTSTFI